MDSIVSSLNFKSLLVYFTPGFLACVSTGWYFQHFGIPHPYVLLKIDSAILQFVFLFIGCISIGMLIEGFRTMVYPCILPNICREIAPTILPRHLAWYEQMYDRVFLSGNLAYNLAPVVLVSPFAFAALEAASCGPLFQIGLALLLNITLTATLLWIGHSKERKFYRILRAAGPYLR